MSVSDNSTPVKVLARHSSSSTCESTASVDCQTEMWKVDGSASLVHNGSARNGTPRIGAAPSSCSANCSARCVSLGTGPLPDQYHAARRRVPSMLLRETARSIAASESDLRPPSRYIEDMGAVAEMD